MKDHRNKQNFAYIDVEVATVNQLKWLEEHLELRSENATTTGEVTTISLIAVDRAGRKFTNCTSLETSFSVKGEGNLVDLGNQSSYSSISKYVKDDDLFSLLSLR